MYSLTEESAVASIDRIIQESVNPFDSTTFRPGNFWQEDQNSAFTVDSIHQEVLTEITSVVHTVTQDHRTRTILLSGDSGSGKSYLLGRIKSTLNSQAFFAYIGPWPESEFIWRHTLRNTVDSLMYVPQGQTESQLLLWLKELAAFQDRTLMKRVFGERQLFIHKLKGTYPAGIYNANEFFGVLYDLTNPKLYPLACEWLKGDDLDESSLKLLRVKRSIDTENAAQQILSNFGKIASATQPIVLCFDNLDNIDRGIDGLINLQALFNVNSIIHNQKLKNFVIIISIITNTWQQNYKRIQPADLARIDTKIRLSAIDLNQAAGLLAMGLYSLHQLAETLPLSPIYPITEPDLAAKFPGGKTLPRFALLLGRQLFQEAKQQPGTRTESVISPSINEVTAAFHLVWVKEFNKTQDKITRLRQFSAPELMQMVREALEALNVSGIQQKLLPSPTYASYSLSYHLPAQLGRIGIVWTEDPNLVSFYHIMKACEKALTMQRCKTLYLIRGERLGTRKNLGNKLYSQIFTGHPHRHILPDMVSVHYLVTYHSLVNAACAGELVVGSLTPNLKELQEMIRQAQILEECPVLQTLGVFAGYTRIIGVSDNKPKQLGPAGDRSKALKKAKEYLLALVRTQQIMGQTVLIQNTLDQFTDVQEYQVKELIFQLCTENKLFILDEKIPESAQLVCVLEAFGNKVRK
nr:AAA family ATPase [Phormidium pseudopriestleyi]